MRSVHQRHIRAFRMENAWAANFIPVRRHMSDLAMAAGRVSRVEFRPVGGQTFSSKDGRMWQNRCYSGFKQRNQSDAGVSHHPFKNILRNAFVGIRVFAKLASLPECSCSRFVSAGPELLLCAAHIS